MYSPEAAREREPDPDTALQEARRRVASLEAALQAMGDFQGPEVDILKNALSRAQQAGQMRSGKFGQQKLAKFGPNTSIEGTACTERRVHPAFAEANSISGAGERAEEQALLEKVLVRQERLKQEVAAAERVPAEVPLEESSTEVLFLRAKVAQLEAERIPHPVRGSVCAAESLRSRLTKRKMENCPEDNLPTNQQDLCSWLESRQLDLRDALDVHDMESVSLLT